MDWQYKTRIQVAGIGFFFLFDFIFYYPKVVMGLHVPVGIFLVICLVYALHIWYFNFFTVYLLHKILPGFRNNFRSRVILLLLLLPLVVLFASLFQSFFFNLLNQQMQNSLFYIHYEDVGMNLLYSLIIVFFLELLYYFQQWTKAVNEAAELKKRNVMSQLQLLKDQISPHFLFNSLNSLSSLIRRDPDDAVQFVHRLSGVYRYLLQTNEKDFSELQEELKFLQSYLHLLTTRFGKALQYTIKIDNDYQSFLILPLSLQLLVENAVKHNVVAAYSPLHIWIGNERDYLVVKNNLQKKKSKAVSHGVGLTNILSKYKLFTDRKVEIIETEDYFTVKLPLVKETNHESLDR